MAQSEVPEANTRPRARVYIDGFNFYYAAYKEGAFGAFKWLDIVAFGEALFPKYGIDLVRYFTARVKSPPSDPDQSSRQDAYLRALAVHPRVSIHFGAFTRHQVTMQRVNPQRGGSRGVLVWKVEEKGSDVNLASWLVADAFRDVFDVAVVVSDDSDLMEPVRIVKDELGKTVVVARVPRYRTAPAGSATKRRKALRASVFNGRVDFIREVREHHFRRSQLPDPVALTDGTHIAKPSAW